MSFFDILLGKVRIITSVILVVRWLTTASEQRTLPQES